MVRQRTKARTGRAADVKRNVPGNFPPPTPSGSKAFFGERRKGGGRFSTVNIKNEYGERDAPDVGGGGESPPPEVDDSPRSPKPQVDRKPDSFELPVTDQTQEMKDEAKQAAIILQQIGGDDSVQNYIQNAIDELRLQRGDQEYNPLAQPPANMTEDEREQWKETKQMEKQVFDYHEDKKKRERDKERRIADMHKAQDKRRMERKLETKKLLESGELDEKAKENLKKLQKQYADEDKAALAKRKERAEARKKDPARKRPSHVTTVARQMAKKGINIFKKRPKNMTRDQEVAWNKRRKKINNALRIEEQRRADERAKKKGGLEKLRLESKAASERRMDKTRTIEKRSFARDNIKRAEKALEYWKDRIKKNPTYEDNIRGLRSAERNLKGYQEKLKKLQDKKE